MSAKTAELKRILVQAKIQEAKRLAVAKDGCNICFKPLDLGGPSCNSPECRLRWEIRTGVKAGPITRGSA